MFYRLRRTNNTVMGPDWKLDRRDSGRLFWRRDSQSDVSPSSPDESVNATPSPSAKERVKFRYDVEVLEFWDAADAGSDDEPEYGRPDASYRNGPMRAKRHSAGQTQSVVACVVCLAAIVATLCYQWYAART